ncbi:MAG: HigA family addiction module antitoxin [Ahrensia sp.]|nr:HigA family addiction module antitoxin [Ahrensia sp.]
MSSSSTITEAHKRNGLGRRMRPGEVLAELYLDPLDMTAHDLSQKILMPEATIQSFLDGERAVDVDLALRLARYFRTKPQLWLNMQANHDLQQRSQEMKEELDAISPRQAQDAA